MVFIFIDDLLRPFLLLILTYHVFICLQTVKGELEVILVYLQEQIGNVLHSKKGFIAVWYSKRITNVVFLVRFIAFVA